jgi:hypothetical protein
VLLVEVVVLLIDDVVSVIDRLSELAPANDVPRTHGVFRETKWTRTGYLPGAGPSATSIRSAGLSTGCIAFRMTNHAWS